MNGVIIPCDDCDRAVYGFDEGQPRGGFIRCDCPLKDARGACNCEDAKRAIIRIGGE